VKRPTLLLFLLATTIVAWSQNNIPGNAVNSSKHYRESGVGNATGRAGAASMTARALLGKDGNSTVEITTGTLDSSTTPPGSIVKIQVKPFSAAGNALFAQNFTSTTSGGYYSFSTQQLHRAQQIQLQANINGIDRNRTDVVTLVETTKLRPDLAVQNLTNPGSAYTNQSVNIAANIVELNGDASATTTCMLAIDGNNVDQVKNVYVDAGGSVSCTFAHKFTTTGSHTIQVTAATVIPADWDTSNNAASGSISIVNPGTAEYDYAGFNDINYSVNNGTYSDLITYLGSTIEDINDVYNYTALHNQLSFAYFYSFGCAGSTNAALWQFPVNLAYAETMDGTSVYSFTDTGVSGYTSSYPIASFSLCNSFATTGVHQQANDYVNDHWLYLYAAEDYDSAANLLYSFQEVQSIRYAGDVTYWSQGYQCEWWYNNNDYCANASDYYTWNSSNGYTYGTLTPVGSTWVPSFATQDAAGNTFSGKLSVSLNSNQYQGSQPNTCNNYMDSNGYTYTYCNSYNYSYTETQGSGVQYSQ